MKKLFCLFALAFFSAIAVNVNAQCTISIGSTTTLTGGITVTSVSASHTVPSGSNRLLVVRVATTNADPTSVTYNGTSLTKQATQHNGSSQYVSIWSLVAPAVGTANLVINGASGFTPIAGATNLTGINQTTPFGTAAGSNFSSSNPSVTVSSATGEVVLDIVNENSYQLTAGSGQTQQFNVPQFVYYGSGSSKSGASSVTMSC